MFFQHFINTVYSYPNLSNILLISGPQLKTRNAARKGLVRFGPVP